jgi:peptidoglycan/LPS O-acetylase OafA/YrhL
MKFKFDNLDSVRTVAFISTFLAHSFSAHEPGVTSSPLYLGAIRFREAFSYGVPVFFVLSGFLISYLMLMEQETTEGFSARNFYIRRVLRIWPLYYLILIFGFVVFPILRTHLLHSPGVETASPLAYSAFLANFDLLAKGLPFAPGLGPVWSVSVEEQFYLLWPILLLLFSKKRFIMPISLLMIGATATTWAFDLPRYHTAHCLIYLTAGTLTAYLSFYSRPFIDRIVRVSPLWFLAAAAAALVLTQSGYTTGIMILVVALLFAYCIVFQCFSGRFPLKRIPFFEWMGKYTYGLYLYHTIAIFVVSSIAYKVLHLKESIAVVVFAIPLVSLLLSILVAWTSYELMERRLLRLKERFAKV